MPPLRHLAFVINASKDGAADIADDLEARSRAAGVETRRSEAYPLPAGFLDGVDACCVIGGDGTLLGIVGEAARAGVPVIGVNRGSLGFLTTFSAEEARLHWAELLAGGGGLVQRALLACRTSPDHEDLALNDILIKDERNSRLVRLEVTANDELVTEYHADGLIFTTPTGSTAYNLSAGGPLIHPAANVIALTPVCPHTLSNRAIIFRDDVTLKVFNRGEGSRLLVAFDGQRNLQVTKTSPLVITLSPRRLTLVQWPRHEHFHVVRTKLKWAGSSAQRPAGEG
jgi:NAD+ kinase